MSQPNFPVVLDISSITPSHGSPNGGTLLHIVGRGFSLKPSQVHFYINSVKTKCNVEAVTGTTRDTENVWCRTVPMTDDLAVSTNYNFFTLGRI